MQETIQTIPFIAHGQRAQVHFCCWVTPSPRAGFLHLPGISFPSCPVEVTAGYGWRAVLPGWDHGPGADVHIPAHTPSTAWLLTWSFLLHRLCKQLVMFHLLWLGGFHLNVEWRVDLSKGKWCSRAGVLYFATSWTDHFENVLLPPSFCNTVQEPLCISSLRTAVQLCQCRCNLSFLKVTQTSPFCLFLGKRFFLWELWLCSCLCYTYILRVVVSL